MERVFYDTHFKISSFVTQSTSHRTRSLIENIVLVLAVCNFCVVILSHKIFVHRVVNANSFFVTSGPGPGPGGGGDGGFLLKNIAATCLRSVVGFDENVDVTHLSIVNNGGGGGGVKRSFACGEAFMDERGKENVEQSCGKVESSSSDVCQRTSNEFCIEKSMDERSNNITYSYSYSIHKGFLQLSAVTLSTYNITTQYVYIHRSDPYCFGEPFLQTLIFDVMAGAQYVVAKNWFYGYKDGLGYIYDPRARCVLDLGANPRNDTKVINSSSNNDDNDNDNDSHHQSYQTFILAKLGILLTSLFLFFVTTTLVSFTLRETQERTVAFALQLQHHVRNNVPNGMLIFRHVVESMVFVPMMVGIIFFLVEFYNGDKVMAFWVLSLVWVCEVYSAVSVRTVQGIIFFPRVFFLYFTLFHVYFFSSPFGFTYASFSSMVLFLTHTMLFFWNRYELPAIVSGSVNASRPRMDITPFRHPVPLNENGNMTNNTPGTNTSSPSTDHNNTPRSSSNNILLWGTEIQHASSSSLAGVSQNANSNSNDRMPRHFMREGNILSAGQSVASFGYLLDAEDTGSDPSMFSINGDVSTRQESRPPPSPPARQQQQQHQEITPSSPSTPTIENTRGSDQPLETILRPGVDDEDEEEAEMIPSSTLAMMMMRVDSTES